MTLYIMLVGPISCKWHRENSLSLYALGVREILEKSGNCLREIFVVDTVKIIRRVGEMNISADGASNSAVW